MSGDLIKQCQSLLRVLHVKAGDGEAGMDDDVVPKRNAVDQSYRYAATNATDLDLDPLIIEQCRDSHRYGQAHTSGHRRGRVHPWLPPRRRTTRG